VPSKQSILITPTKLKNIERAGLLISTVRAFLKKNSAKVRRSLSRNATLNQKTQTKDKFSKGAIESGDSFLTTTLADPRQLLAG
jgi:hypothetical protein